ncbi:NADP-dependent phosphogluconate dehydrogenase [Garicola koreensis]|uniref:6-phosphogluconate dehydrogenase, decarboxylating n=1 Tax=Garicola koreensis TaxID=1262554 RepID=A0A7W5TT12_9MICC|nr:NADP-dependent phosphogluconate dehydrogenase [Garicola koreensis]MBB3666928.1 6-phosphogluconate dehydrogenase [Garicola koreensis]
MGADIGVTGLAVMGANLARNLARNGYTVALHNRTVARTDALINSYSAEGAFVRTESLTQLVEALEPPRRVLVMVKAGAPVDAVIDELVPLLDAGDIVIDAGNSFYEETRRREEALRQKGLHFVGVGVSGGEEGALHGPSIMPGGSAESYQTLGPMLESIAAEYHGEPCCAWVGTDGAGHYVKMVHNGIEYADMQVIGEAYDLMRSLAGLEPGQQAQVFRDWNTTDLASYLIEISSEVLEQEDELTGRPLVDVITDSAGQKGTGRWTAISGLEVGSPVSTIAESVFARSISSQRTLRQQAQQVFTAGVSTSVAATDLYASEDAQQDFVEDVRKALYASKLVSYAQGFDMLTAAGEEYGWDLDMRTIASLWRAGCIIRADLLDTIMKAYEAPAGQRPANLLFAEEFTEAINECLPAWRRVVAAAATYGVPAPVFSSSLAYYDALRAERLPASLTQGLRDYFGAHTYQRIDKPGTFHTRWSEDRSETEV